MTRLKAAISSIIVISLVATGFILTISCSDLSVNYAPTGGTTWEIRASRIAEKLSAVIWTGDRYMAVGGHKILTSPDGYTWQLRHTYNAGELKNVCWTGDQFYVVGDGVIIKSSDAVSWTEGTINADLIDVAAIDGVILAIGTSSEVYISSDGEAWELSCTRYLQQVYYGISADTINCRVLATPNDSYFWAAGEDYRIFSSQDGVEWTPVYNRATLAGYHLLGIAYATENWVGAGEYGYIVGYGLAEDYVASRLTNRHLRAVATDGFEWVIVGDGGTIISRTPDSASFDQLVLGSRKSPTALNLNDVVWNGGGFLAVGDSGIVIASPANR